MIIVLYLSINDIMKDFMLIYDNFIIAKISNNLSSLALKCAIHMLNDTRSISIFYQFKSDNVPEKIYMF